MEIQKEIGDIELISHTIVRNPYTSTLLHIHENFEFCVPLETACDFLVDGTLVHAQPGDIVTIEPRVVHQFLPKIPATPVLVIQFPYRILIQSDVSATSLQTHISREAMEAIPGLFQAVNALTSLTEQELPVLRGQKNPLLQSLILSLYLLLLKHFPQARPNRRKDGELFSRAVTYVNTHFEEDTLSVARIASALFISREKLSWVFRQYAGISCKQYITALRINQVNQLLSLGQDVTTACMHSGFSSIRTFNSAYKSATGMTPTEYLKTLG